MDKLNSPAHSPGCEILIVGDYPSKDDERQGSFFSGSAGYELREMLSEAGIPHHLCSYTAVVKTKVPGKNLDEWVIPTKRKTSPGDGWVNYDGKWMRDFIATDLDDFYKEVAAVNPKIILALGNFALWALCRESSVAQWRGSQLQSIAAPHLPKSYFVLPTYPPDYIQRVWKDRTITVLDLKRAKRELANPHRVKPKKRAIIAPTFQQTGEYLADVEKRLELGPTPLVIDLEIKRGAILCIGLGTTPDIAFCLPFWHEIPYHPDTEKAPPGMYYPGTNPGMVTARYWEPDDELAIAMRLRAILLHPNVKLINQNIGFDLQFLCAYYHCLPVAAFDTMIAQHVMLPGTPKSLDYLHSIYGQEYRYWKDDGKFWKDNARMNYPQLWAYNCEDIFTTFEVYLAQAKSLQLAKLVSQFKEQMRKLNHFKLTMYRGVRVNEAYRSELLKELIQLIGYEQYRVNYMVNMELNPSSPKQLQEFFYGKMRLKPVFDPETKRPTTNDDALKELAENEPLVLPVTTSLNLIRSYHTSLTVCNAKTSRWTGRWHPCYNTGGTDTFRCSSTKNVWDEAVNTQNLTKGKEIAK